MGISLVTRLSVVALTVFLIPLLAVVEGEDKEKGEEKEFSNTRVLRRCLHFVDVSTTVVKKAFSTITFKERVR